MNQPSDEAATVRQVQYRPLTKIRAHQHKNSTHAGRYKEQWRNVRQIQEMPWGETNQSGNEDDVESKSKPIDDPGASIKGTVTETSSAKLKVRINPKAAWNTRQNPVLVDARRTRTVTPGGVVEVDQIKDVGFFTREQIEIMRRVENLKSTVQLGLDSHKWLSEEALPALVLNITGGETTF
ncbi:hypothetical protein GQ600_14395 [Phytophthora cactorum]|nr:hypothetical protein GQ600_14395 [Phytophthora cactorum]